MKQLERAQRALRTTEERLAEIAVEIEAAQIALAEAAADEAGGDKRRAGERAGCARSIERLEHERSALAAALPILRERHTAAVLTAAPQAEIRLADALETHNSRCAALRESILAAERELARLREEYAGLQNCDLSRRLGLVRGGDAGAILAALE